ncbi:MAG TPA: hypothetical protein VF665_24780 [Longimicrobium sp.]|jgi:hypothetical protein|uniref:hypothetical protein n=1 Tax=Longimicrobium sp. TaxID=2029185 RepID=UPI002ED885D4
MTPTLLLVLAGAAALLPAGRHLMTPPCPRCRRKKYDRSVCRPLLLCRRCATRVDSMGRAHN